LIRKLGVEIVTGALRFRKIDNTDCALQPWLPQESRGFFLPAEWKQKIPISGFVKKRFVTPG
jgi:hypothetical protein